MLCCHLLGDAVARAIEQGGNIIHEIMPINGNEGGQYGTSIDGLEWHTEDAFHPKRMDYVALLCIRNLDLVPTTYASVDDLILDEDVRAQLFRPDYPFQPDEGNRADKMLTSEETVLKAELISQSHARVTEMFENPERVAAFFGSKLSPYIRVHPHYIADFSDDEQATLAFQALKSEVTKNIKEVPLEPGDLFIIDNYKAVHGRSNIPPHFDGTDRWLKRAFIARDLRKTRSLRISPSHRVVY